MPHAGKIAVHSRLLQRLRPGFRVGVHRIHQRSIDIENNGFQHARTTHPAAGPDFRERPGGYFFTT